jgi:hypothetical protein
MLPLRIDAKLTQKDIYIMSKPAASKLFMIRFEIPPCLVQKVHMKIIASLRNDCGTPGTASQCNPHKKRATPADAQLKRDHHYNAAARTSPDVVSRVSSNVD